MNAARSHCRPPPRLPQTPHSSSLSLNSASLSVAVAPSHHRSSSSSFSFSSKHKTPEPRSFSHNHISSKRKQICEYYSAVFRVVVTRGSQGEQVHSGDACWTREQQWMLGVGEREPPPPQTISINAVQKVTEDHDEQKGSAFCFLRV